MSDPEFVKRESVLILAWTKLPKEIRKVFSDRHNWHNDCYINFGSEFEPTTDEDWSETLSLDAVNAYYKGQCETNDFVGDLDAFIKDYGLEAEMWLIGLNLDLQGVKRILIEISI